MPKLRKEFTQDFTIIYNTILRDKRVGSSPRGVYCTMVSMSDGWNFTIRGLAAVMGEGVTKIANALKKLEETKYLKRERVYEKGRIVDWEYFIYDEPYEAPDEDQSCDNVDSPIFIPSQDADLQDTELLDTENLNQGQSHLENQDAYKITIKEESKKEKSMEEESIYQSAPAAQRTVENSADDRQMDGYVSEKAVYTDVVKQNIDFFDFAEWLKDESEAEEIVQMIVRQICSRKPTERICGQEFPREVVKSAMLKVDIEVLQNAIEQMEHIDDRQMIRIITHIVTVRDTTAEILASLCTHFKNSLDFLACGTAVPLIEQIDDRHHVQCRTAAISGIHIIVQSDKADIVHRENVVDVAAHFNIITTEAAEDFHHHDIDLAELCM